MILEKLPLSSQKTPPGCLVRSVEYPKEGTHYGSEKEEGDEQENGPETAGTAATAVVTMAAG